MNLFEPRTFSTDWEIMVIDRLERCVGEEKLSAFAGIMRNELDVPVQIDWRTLEFAMGINTSFAQLWERIQKVTNRASQLVREYDLDLFPAGAHPIEPMFNANHIHVGTIRDESAGIQLESHLLRYAPAFAALAANSPVSHRRRGEFKSMRVRHRAHGCVQPVAGRDPNLSQNAWGFDAGVKMQGAPTLEVRIADCSSSRRLLAELATFVAAFVHQQGTKTEYTSLTAQGYKDYLSNRWAAARYGLQATFCWEGQSKSVAELLAEMLDECGDALRVLGTTPADLGIINAMLQKRICQADFVRDVASRYADDYTFASAYSKLMRHWTIFEEYLETAQPLEPVVALDENAIMEAHLEIIGEGTHFYHSREAMFYPPPVADALMEQMIERGVLKREVTPERGTLLYRVAAD
jgi:gamma-glutamyl:cysteine ligase YbdK (ATP-grasp superfamily)